MRVKVITDSTAYLPADIIDKYNITVVPLNVHFEGEVFKEGTRYSYKEYYDKLRKSSGFPITSQPSAGEFLEVFEQLASGQDALVILLSTKISGTFQSANMARDLLTDRNVNVHLVDSEFSGMGLGFQVIEACELLEAGKSIDEVTSRLAEMRKKMHLYFVVDNLEYLARGGRMSTISCKLGTLIQLKPVLALQEGELALFQKVRTLPRAMAVVLAELNKAQDSISKIAIINVEYQEKALQLQEQLQQKYDVPVSICELGPVVGSHLGPGSLGVVFY
ncbi:degv family protein [hydrocarbon metagenome]|uniref:Degv family protein n=1 Tax=hydrocarbon metagenome TaxID=938273 RepID=A0A0W8E4A9_9ZZZZ